jgi:hypothetical protein
VDQARCMDVRDAHDELHEDLSLERAQDLR